MNQYNHIRYIGVQVAQGTASGYVDVRIQCDLLQPEYITTFTIPDKQPHPLLTSMPIQQTPPEQSSDSDLSEVVDHNMSMGSYHPSQVTEDSQESQGSESS